jgi:hypothetical protein
MIPHSSFVIFITIPFASLKAQNVMKCIGFELFFYYPIAIGVTVNYKSRGGEWAASFWSDRIFICVDCLSKHK